MAMNQNLPLPTVPVKTSIAKRLAYSGIPQSQDMSRVFRLERGQPLLRAAKPVLAVPQFKAQTLYSPVSTNSPTGSFQVKNTPVSINYPRRFSTL